MGMTLFYCVRREGKSTEILDPADQPLTIDADGALRFEEGTPRFDGALTLARPAAAGVRRDAAASRCRGGRPRR